MESIFYIFYFNLDLASNLLETFHIDSIWKTVHSIKFLGTSLQSLSLQLDFSVIVGEDE